GEGLSLSIPVSNTGKLNGTEVVQVYVGKINDTNGPLKTLRGFQRVNVTAGRTRTATIDLLYKSFEFYDESKLKLAVTPGEYEVWYGNSSASKDLKKIKISITQ